MFNEKKFNELKKDMYLRAFQRWKRRKDIRDDPEKLKVEDPKDFRLSQERMDNYLDRESVRKQKALPAQNQVILNERIIRNNDLRFFAPNEQAKQAGIPVARIEMMAKPGYEPEGFATGFLIAPNLLMTNFHVFGKKEDAKGCAAHFMYERSTSGLQNGYSFELKPDEFFMCDEKLDFAIVYVSSTSVEGTITLRNFKPLQLIDTKGKIVKGDPLSIIQYAGGGPKQYAYTDNLVLDILEEEGFIQYSTDTLPGSSGSPCFNPYWEIAALHHCGVPFVNDQGKIMSASGAIWDGESEDDIQWIANEGISISKIVAHLKNEAANQPAANELLKALIASTKDPLYMPKEKASTGVPVYAAAVDKAPVINNIIPTSTLKDMSTINFNFNGPTSVSINTQPSENPVSVSRKTDDLSMPALMEKKQLFDENYDSGGRKGYDDEFLQGFKIKLPSVSPQREDELFMDYHTTKPYVLNYYHYSLVMNKKRRFCMWTASNADYNPDVKSTKKREEFGTEGWRLDPRIPPKYQVQDADLYKPATNIDRGHIVRREDNCWGESEVEIEYANADTYHWTNCTPQHERFNQARDGGYQGLWGKLEAAIQAQLNIVDNKAIQFAGPVLRTEDDAEDFGTGKIQYPNLYWKIVLVNESEQGLVAYGFILDQTYVVKKYGLYEESLLDFQQFKAQQVTIQKITEMTDVVFDRQVYDADVLKNNPAVENGAVGFNNESMLYLKPKKEPGITKNKIKPAASLQ